MKLIKTALILSTFILLPKLVLCQIFDTDVIIEGSLCVGDDCVTDESFGTDTQRLKENNVRLHFDDSSISSSFPSNDWRITINDSSVGGDNYFGIDDATAGTRPFNIEAGAGNNAIHIDASEGNIGLGTDSPLFELHIMDGNSPTIRFEQDASNDWNPQIWDIAGNETNFFIRDVTNGSTLPFKIKPGAPTNSLFINASGNITLGSQSEDDEKLLVKGNLALSGDIHFKNGTGSDDDVFKFVSSDTSLALQDAASSNNIMVVNTDAPSNSLFIHDSGAISMGTDVENRKLNINGGLTVNGDIYALSDRRLKKDITEIKYGLSDIMKLSAKQYNFNNSNYTELNLSKDLQLGLIAQEVQKIMPEVVTNDIKTKDNKGEITTLKGVNYSGLIPVLIQAIQDQQLLIDEKNTELASLKTQMDQLSVKVNKMMNYIGKNNVQPLNNKNASEKDDYSLEPTSKPAKEETPQVKVDNGRSAADTKKNKEGKSK